MKVPTVLKGPVGQYLILGVGGLVAVYVLFKYVVPKLPAVATKGIGEGIGNALNALNQGLGNNDLTKQQTDFAGNSVDYSGHGAISALGAETNSLLGGIPASIGNWLGGVLPGSGNDYDPNASTPSAVNRDQVVTQNYVTDIGQTTDFGTTDPNSWD